MGRNKCLPERDPIIGAKEILFVSKFCDKFVSPLSEAIAERQPEMITLLFDHGADVNFGSEKGLTPLCVAAWYDDSSTIAALLRRGAKIEARDEEGYTALLKAASQAKGLEAIKLLIASGADITARTDNYGDTALLLASYNLNVDAVRFFVASGLDPCGRNKDGESAIDYANIKILHRDEKMRSKTREEIRDLLKSRCKG